MGKTTNALEKVIEHYFNSKHELQSSIQDVKKYHNGILLELFENESHEVFKVVNRAFFVNSRSFLTEINRQIIVLFTTKL